MLIRLLFILMPLIFVVISRADVESDIFLRPQNMMDLPLDANGTYSLPRTHACSLQFKGHPANTVKKWSGAESLRLRKRTRPEVRDGKNHTALEFETCTSVWIKEKKTLTCLKATVDCNYPLNATVPSDACLVASNFGKTLIVSQLNTDERLATQNCAPAPTHVDGSLLSPTSMVNTSDLKMPEQTVQGLMMNPPVRKEDLSTFEPVQ